MALKNMNLLYNSILIVSLMVPGHQGTRINILNSA